MVGLSAIVVSLALLPYKCFGKVYTDPSQLVKKTYDFVIVGGMMPLSN